MVRDGCQKNNLVNVSIISMMVIVQLLLGSDDVAAFSLTKTGVSHRSCTNMAPLYMAGSKSKNKKGKKKAGGKSVTGLKGFGSASTSSALPSNVELDKSKPTLDFYEYMEQNGAGGPQLKRVALAYFDGFLRGVVALKDINKGEAILDIPYEMAWNLGRESADPTLPAITVLQDYVAAKRKNGDHIRGPYLEMLPKYMSDDCLGSTDFFSQEALDALQSPLIVEETEYRHQLCGLRFERDIEPLLPPNTDLYLWDKETNEAVTEQHLRWAVWLVTSRVLTVQGEIPQEKYRLMIPFIDMCNHDRNSPHVLTGRAVPGGRLKVTAGCNIKQGEQINICYGGGVVGNDRFIQDYAFLDAVDKAYDLVAKILTGRQRVLEGKNVDRPTLLPVSDRQQAMEALKQTTIEEDQAILENSNDMPNDVKSAIQYRLGVKLALQKLGDF